MNGAIAHMKHKARTALQPFDFRLHVPEVKGLTIVKTWRSGSDGERHVESYASQFALANVRNAVLMAQNPQRWIVPGEKHVHYLPL
ncbi:MAG: hypothetical protein ACLQNE_10830 [Thermoguttaceae bacterium]